MKPVHAKKQATTDKQKPALKKKLKPTKKQKQKAKPKPKDSDASSDEDIPPLKETRISDEPVPKKTRWTNKQRVLVLCARGINHRDRHLMNDLKTLMPHHRAEPKMERWKTLSVVNEMSEMKHCNKVILFEGRRKRDLYMWLANVGKGPSVKFLIENIHTMGEMKLTGNCLRGSRPLLSFDQEFTKHPHLALIKELLTQTFGVPNQHPKSQPFIDRVISFTYLDNRIWYRHFQILSEDGGLTEIGPRFVMNPIKIFNGSFEGVSIWENPDYQSPAKHRQMLRKAASTKYLEKTKHKINQELHAPKNTHDFDPYGEIFQDDAERKAEQLVAKEEAQPQRDLERQQMEAMQKREKQKDAMRQLKLAAAKKNARKKASKIVGRKQPVDKKPNKRGLANSKGKRQMNGRGK
ncbi:ribosome biogenesis protein BRX1 homolog [Anopheles bellator]|uniref:ribosome biogenesis protein BRX1 homolog n=1 Tax=Anopheles bellator TaxID=139047 RepID=UPI00264900F5|nr:ribosome biogenesis protein BRX1 homolog [Anopheles bellator]